MRPLCLEHGDAQTDGQSWFSLACRHGFFELSREAEGGDWSKVLIINPEPQPWERFTERCLWQQRSPESPFARKRLCTRATPQGRVTLTGNTLKEVGEQSVETAVAETEYVTVLAERFGMMLHDASWSNPLV
jgi:N-hydroxyarylamine O-acetyltransferase